MKTTKKWNKMLLVRMFGMVLAFGMLVMSCDGLGTALTTPDENGNLPLNTTKTYRFYNDSSYTVTVYDDTGSATLAPGDSFTGKFNYEQSIDDVYYSPSFYVKVTKSGSTSFTFTNK
ncbi:hypothetical protein AGMMS49991_03490 [Spirochaetia bacterium]|nr:hypothetical protein AGMMS49991_03490 [Spirochaetia bacterium]